MKPESCKHFIPDFNQLLLTVQPERVSDDLYCQNYLRHTLQHASYYLNIYASVLDCVLEKLTTERNQIKLLDYGTGNGLLGLFAKYCGFEKVYCLDIDPMFLSAAENLSKQIHIVPDGFIEGDIQTFETQTNGLSVDVIVGTDVIEHIYNLDSFFDSINIINPNMITVFTTASNPENYFKSKKLIQLQKRDELIGYTGDDLDNAQHASFWMMRKEIIQKNFPKISEPVLDELSSSTRGMRQDDILVAVASYIKTSVYPIPEDDYNTCNPLNGSWTERLLPIEKYRHIYNKHQFAFELQQGFYNSFTPGTKKFVNAILNIFIKTLGGKVSPFIILVGYKK